MISVKHYVKCEKRESRHWMIVLSFWCCWSVLTAHTSLVFVFSPVVLLFLPDRSFSFPRLFHCRPARCAMWSWRFSAVTVPLCIYPMYLLFRACLMFIFSVCWSPFCFDTPVPGPGAPVRHSVLVAVECCVVRFLGAGFGRAARMSGGYLRLYRFRPLLYFTLRFLSRLVVAL